MYKCVCLRETTIKSLHIWGLSVVTVTLIYCDSSVACIIINNYNNVQTSMLIIAI